LSKKNSFQNIEIHDLCRLLIAGEDHRFKYHKGVDVIALVRAFWRTIFLNRREGASTIAMQLVRVLSNRYDATLSRKILEMYLALRLTKYATHKEILSLYLSIAYFGWNMHGLYQACKKLNLDIKNLNLKDAAGLIARLKYPEPKILSEKRITQIETRSTYIIKRYQKLHIREKHGSI
jgi:penicillin-binding protein 1A